MAKKFFNMHYTLIRSNRKTLAIQINKHAEIIVRAPLGVPLLFIEKFLEEKSEWILKNQQKMREKNLKNPKKNLSETEILEMKNNLKKYILPKVAEWHAKTNFPAYGTIKITKSETRWGSCSGKNNLNFSYRLAEFL